MPTSPLNILLEDGPVMVVDKPAGLLTQAPRGIDSLEEQIKQHLIVRENKPGKAYLAVIHRLDRPVTGALVFAKHVRAARRLAEQFQSRDVQKTYWALVAGEVRDEEGTWRDVIRKIPDVAQAELTESDQPDAREAILHYRRRAVRPWGTWLEIILETGRYHQIRLQAASHGHPILGDALYGSQHPFGKQFADERQRAIALHARRLAFTHPMTQEPIDVACPLPRNWAEVDGELFSQT